MECGVLYHKKLRDNSIKEVGFSSIEIRCGEKTTGIVQQAKGMIVPLKAKEIDNKKEVERVLKEGALEYLVVETCGCDELSAIEQFVEVFHPLIKENNLKVYVENGFIGDDAQGYVHCVYSQVEILRKIVLFGNQELGGEYFGICLNIGYGNLLAQNMRGMIEEANEYRGLIHINDNDGFHNDKQMPYTFTKGRGQQTTDWKRIWGALWRIGYDKRIVFDTEGLFEKTPEPLEKQMMKMLRSIVGELEEINQIECLLGQKGKKRILFGSGLMFYNYMASFGEIYPPEFIVDNDKNKWGTSVLGIPVKNPEEILSVPDKERNVIICNMHYDEIGQQLRRMGIKYHKYRDYYYNDSELLIGG